MNKEEELQPKETIEALAEEWAKDSFQELPNAIGQPRQTPVGQNPHGWEKHFNLAKRSFIKGHSLGRTTTIQEIECFIQNVDLNNSSDIIIVDIINYLQTLKQ